MTLEELLEIEKVYKQAAAILREREALLEMQKAIADIPATAKYVTAEMCLKPAQAGDSYIQVKGHPGTAMWVPLPINLVQEAMEQVLLHAVSQVTSRLNNLKV